MPSFIFFVSPSILISVSFVMVLFVYLFYMEEIAIYYLVDITYGPLLLWGIAVCFVALGDMVAKLFFRIKATNQRSSDAFRLSMARIDSRKLKRLFTFGLFGLLTTSALIISESGFIPVISLALERRDIVELNQAQEYALPGIYGLHSLFVYLNHYCILLICLLSIDSRQALPVRVYLYGAFVIAATLIDGKRQGSVMLICSGIFVLLAYVRLTANGFRDVLKKFGFVLVSLFAAITLIFYGLAYYRSLSVGFAEEVLFEPLRYLAFPQLNLEVIYGETSWTGLDIDMLKPLELLVPAKLMLERGSFGIMLPEPTSPSGFFASAYLFWGGVVGVAFYSICVGLFSGFVHTRIFLHPLAMLLYGNLIWQLLMSHTYNHFLTITFLPLQIVVLGIINVIAFRR